MSRSFDILGFTLGALGGVSPSVSYGKIFARKVSCSWRIMRKEIDSFLSEEKGSSYQMSLKQ